MAPVHIAQISEQLTKKSYDLSNLIALQTCGSALPMATQEAFKKFYSKVIIMTGYGITDVGGGVTFSSSEAENPKAVGKLFPGVKIKVILFFLQTICFIHHIITIIFN